MEIGNCVKKKGLLGHCQCNAFFYKTILLKDILNYWLLLTRRPALQNPDKNRFHLLMLEQI
jgi:hypothetical protein